MSNLAAAFKSEIARIARKEIRAETEALKKTTTRLRSELASLKRELVALQKQSRSSARTARVASVATQPKDGDGPRLRFRSGGLASHRKRLGISAEEVGKLIGVSGQTVYSWEAGKSRPRASQLPAISALRTLGKRQARAVLAQR